MAYSPPSLKSLNDFALKTFVGSKYTAVKPRLPAASESKVNSGFVGGQLLSGSFVP
jgi:hypothetical protein